MASDASEATHSGPFAGLGAVEFGRFIAAPFCAQFLADLGAEVIKVEPTDGDQTRRNGPIIPGEGLQFLNKNRGKRSLAVNLRDVRALEAVHSLVGEADIVIANFRPGIAEELALDYASVSARNDRVIYAENTGFGQEGSLAGQAGMDVVIQAYSGLAPLTDQGPLMLANPIIDYMAGVLLTGGIASALYARERSGRGQRVDVSLSQAALVLQNNTAHHVEAVAGWRTEFVDYLHDAYARDADWTEILEQRQHLHPYMVPRAYYGFFNTSDGVIAIAGGGSLLQQRIVEVLGIEDPWVTDPEWEPPEDLKSYQRAQYDTVTAIYREQTSAHWLHAFAEAGVPCREYHTVEEIVDDEQAWANGYFTRYEHELLGGASVVGPPIALSETPLASQGAPPVLGKHTRELLARGGLDGETIEALIADGAAVAYD